MAGVRQDNYPNFPQDPFYHAIALGAGTYNLASILMEADTIIKVRIEALLFQGGGSNGGSISRVGTFKLDATGVPPTQIGATSAPDPDALDTDLLGSTIVFRLSTNDYVSVDYSHSSANAYYLHRTLRVDILTGAV